MENRRTLIWDQKALTKLEKALKWISEKSISQAEQVEQAILQNIQDIRLQSDSRPISTRGIIQAITVLLRRIVTGYLIIIPKKKSGY